MRDSSWDKKQKVLQQFSIFKITTDYLSTSAWNEYTISTRATDLLTYAKEIWKS